MKLYSLNNDDNWLNPLKQSWSNFIQSKCIENEWENCQELIDTCVQYLDQIKVIFESYVSSLSLATLKSLLLTFYVYCTFKNMTILGENNPPSIPLLIPPDDDLRRKYSYWTYELPDPNQESTSSWFTVEEDPGDSQKGIIKATEDFEQFLLELSELSSVDESSLSSLRNILSTISNSLVLHLTFVKPRIQMPQNFDPKSYILNTMHVQDILDEFGWSIPEIYPM